MRLPLLALLALLPACEPPVPSPAETYLARAFEWGLGSTSSQIAAGYPEAPDVYRQATGEVWVFYPGGFVNREAYSFEGDSCTVVQRGRVYDTEVVMLQALEQRVADVRAAGVPLVMNGGVYEYEGERVKVRLSGRVDALSMNARRYEVIEAFLPVAALSSAGRVQ